MNTPITVIASNTIDHLVDTSKGVIFDIKGGPALFCLEALKEAGVSTKLITSEVPAQVSIKIDDKGERVAVDSIKPIDFIPEETTENIIISPILHEIDLKKLSSLIRNIYLDAQGYVRTRGSDKMTTFPYTLEDLKNVRVLKVNSAESQFISEEIIEEFKKRVLLLTRGKDGLELWDKGVRYRIKGKEIPTTNTIGAGDFFLGTFVAQYLERRDSFSSAQIALSKTENFLQRKSY